jgi:hypothetical protein
MELVGGCTVDTSTAGADDLAVDSIDRVQAVSQTRHGP